MEGIIEYVISPRLLHSTPLSLSLFRRFRSPSIVCSLSPCVSRWNLSLCVRKGSNRRNIFIESREHDHGFSRRWLVWVVGMGSSEAHVNQIRRLNCRGPWKIFIFVTFPSSLTRFVKFSLRVSYDTRPIYTVFDASYDLIVVKSFVLDFDCYARRWKCSNEYACDEFNQIHLIHFVAVQYVC